MKSLRTLLKKGMQMYTKKKDGNKQLCWIATEAVLLGVKPLGIAYNNIQITYRNTSLQSSTLKENHVCDLLTDGTRNKTGVRSTTSKTLFYL